MHRWINNWNLFKCAIKVFQYSNNGTSLQLPNGVCLNSNSSLRAFCAHGVRANRINDCQWTNRGFVYCANGRDGWAEFTNAKEYKHIGIDENQQILEYEKKSAPPLFPLYCIDGCTIREPHLNATELIPFWMCGRETMAQNLHMHVFVFLCLVLLYWNTKYKINYMHAYTGVMHSRRCSWVSECITCKAVERTYLLANVKNSSTETV